MKAIQTVLVANRGEIAVRVMRTAKAMGLKTVAVYSDADADALHVRTADLAVPLGGNTPAESYLVGEAILEAARTTGADAIHPGYGFLSENTGFAAACAEAGVIFIGPPAQAVEVMGDKALAKRAMLEAKVPCIPGYQGEDQSDDTLCRGLDHDGHAHRFRLATERFVGLIIALITRDTGHLGLQHRAFGERLVAHNLHRRRGWADKDDPCFGTGRSKVGVL